MRWEGRRQSENVEDRRRVVAGPMVLRGGIGTIVLLLVLLFLGVSPQELLHNIPELVDPQPAPQQPVSPDQNENDALKQFVSVVLADTEDVWGTIFPTSFLKPYSPPALVLFTGQVKSACGLASAASGPFYCPLDQKVYIDLAFYEELRRRFGAPGDFAQAYVIAHEIGHHVQNQLGIAEKVQAMKGRISDREYNKISVRMELQADFLAGVWAHNVAKYKGVVDEEDIREAVHAAAAIGDDAILKTVAGLRGARFIYARHKRTAYAMVSVWIQNW